MSNPLAPRRSFTPNSVPIPSTDIRSSGELLINWADGKLFTKDASGNLVTINAGGGSGGSGGGSASIVSAATVAGFPSTGSASNLYVATDSRKIYGWDATNSVYVELGPVGGGSADLSPFFVPPAPTGLTAVPANGQVSLSWSAPTVLAQTPITDYAVQFKESSASLWTTFSDGTSTATSAVVTGLTNGTAYTFRVAAVNGVGTGAYVTSASITPQPIIAQYLAIAGGGGGGTVYGGGGGAGGYLEGLVGFATGVQYAVVIGGGGAGSTSGSARGTNGSNSTVNGLTAIGGGGGGSENATGGASGGSGGGNTYLAAAGGAGTEGQGYAGGAGNYVSPSTGCGGGGGGASAVGGNASGRNAGAGGDGRSSSITGSAVTRAGGGGGGVLDWAGGTVGTEGAGGSGGGGAGGKALGSAFVATAGQTNTGSGGGGGGDATWIAAAGGSGLVVIRSPQAAASTTGSPTVTTVGGDTVYTFTGSGSITF